MFKGKITDCFEVPGKGLAVMLTEIEGTPRVGALVDFLGGHRSILDVGQNSADGQPVSTWRLETLASGVEVEPVLTRLGQTRPRPGTV